MMKLIDWTLLGKPKRLIQDSRKIRQNDCFIATIGEKVDSRQFIMKAISMGAVGVIWEKTSETDTLGFELPNHIGSIGIVNLKDKLGEIANEFYQYPSHRLWILGVTGTNGKTSCTQWFAKCMTAFGKTTAVIGTTGHGVLHKPLIQTQNTTPMGIELHSLLHHFVDEYDEPIESVAMEVSSHGLHQNRVAGVKFDVAIFTNLTRDHLDYHGTMEDYLASKLKLMQWSSLKHIVINIDDPAGQTFIDMFKETHKHLNSDQAILTYGIHHTDADLYFSDIQTTDDLSTQAVLHYRQQSMEFQTKIIGQFNLYNLLAVCGGLLSSGISLKHAVRLLEDLDSVNGRMETIHPEQNPHKKAYPLVLVDYAHTPDALENALQTLRLTVDQDTSNLQRKITCVFGCGGNRDQGKRPLMGNIAGKLADQVIITNDNPRLEDPQFIIQQIQEGINPEDQLKFEVIPDRLDAIKTAISTASPHDIILVAGKGHEAYQDIQGIKLPFSDQAVVSDILEWYLKK